MVFEFLRRKAKAKRKNKRRKTAPKSQPCRASQISQESETKMSQSLGTNETNQILARLDVIMGFLREHHGVIKNQIQEAHSDLREQLLALGMARKVLKETSLDKIVQKKLSQGETKSQIVRQLIDTGACSRATAYRVLEKNEEPQMSQVSPILSQRT